MPPPLVIRGAASDDVPVILSLVRGLAEYERLLHEVVATEEDLRQNLFGERRYAEVLLAEQGGCVLGFALFFHNFSTFLGKPGSTSRMSSCGPNTAGTGSAPRSLCAWRSLRANAAAVAWSGTFSTRTNPQLHSTRAWAPVRRMNHRESG